MNEDTALQDFLKDLPSEDKNETDLFSDNLQAPAAQADDTDTPAKDSEPYKNRRHRRLEAQLQNEREENIRLKALAEGRSEARQFAQENNVDERLLEMYGNTDDGKKAARLHMELLNDATSKGKELALQELKEERARETEAQKKYESFIDSELEAIEDEHNVDITSDAPAARKLRREFLEIVQKLSPKDSDGTITSFADFGGVWESFSEKRAKPDNSRAKDVASRSMAPTGSVDASKTEDDTNRAYLRSIGINV